MAEQLLTGGFVSQVWRVGDTVRRTAGAWTPTIHRLLNHVRGKGVGWVPQPQGIDERGREVLSFIPGDVPHEMPEWVWSEVVLQDASRALRQWHDATADFVAPEAAWGLEAREPNEVVCHNDFAPYNCVFRNGRFVGAIDFDQCAPGPRIWDVAYTAYRFIPLVPEAGASEFGLESDASPFGREMTVRRLQMLLDAYGAGVGWHLDQAAVLEVVSQRVEAIAGWSDEQFRRTGVAELQRHAVMYREHARWMRRWTAAG